MEQSFGKKKLNCQDLYGYLLTLSPAVFVGLYEHPFTCLAVFRGLSDLAKHYVMRTLFIDQPLPETLISTWAGKEIRTEHETAISRLKGLQIWKNANTGTPVTCYCMNTSFQNNLRIGLCGGGPLEEEPLKTVEEKYARDIDFLDTYSKERWESVLYFITGSVGDNTGVSEETAKVLINSGLLSYVESDSTPTITSAGFQFLLLPISQQTWYFMVEYLNSKDGNTLVECLSFLFQISFSVLGKDYSVKNITEMQFNFLQLLREIGFAYQRKRKSKRFYPTRLAINLGKSVSGDSTTASQGKGFLVVETNYRVYAYTKSALEIALLSLFTHMKSRFPEFCVGILSRESVQQALSCGISAIQIIEFLQSRAHPQMLIETPILPPTITDQIKLWELERDRLRYSEGVLYNQFLSQTDYEMLRRFAEERSVLLWSNNQKRLMVVSKAGHDSVKTYWKRNKPS